jgi:hypothetical protein
MFQRRKQEFSRSLQQILIQVSHDKIVRNLLQDRASSQFVCGRIEEVISGILTDDRERYIDVLLQKLQTFEALYSREHTSSIRSLGDRLISISREQNADALLQPDVVRLRATQVENVATDSLLVRGRSHLAIPLSRSSVTILRISICPHSGRRSNLLAQRHGLRGKC